MENTDQKVENTDQKAGSKDCVIRKTQLDSNGDASETREGKLNVYLNSELFSVKLRPKTDSNGENQDLKDLNSDSRLTENASLVMPTNSKDIKLKKMQILKPQVLEEGLLVVRIR